jgi:hypothetical protein
MKSIYEYLILENNKNLNVKITPENFNKFKFSRKQSMLIKHLLDNDYKESTTEIYLVQGDIIPDDVNIKEYFGELIPKDERGILYINAQSTSMGSPKEVYFYNTSKVNEKNEKETFVYSYHSEGGSKFKSAVLTTDGVKSNIELKTENILH